MKRWLKETCRRISTFRGQVSPPYYELCPIGVWAGDKDYAAYISLDTGRLLGYYRHDGHGKWDLTVYVGLYTAWKILLTQPAGIASWAPFPRCAVWIFRKKDRHSARLAVEELSDIGG